MPDRGRAIEFGANVDPLAAAPDEALRIALAADRAGLELVAIQDHPYNRTHLDTWTLMATLAARTERVRFVTDVANLPLRPPAMLAKAAATLDVLTGGRVELGLGAGAFWDAIRAYGGPVRSPREAVDALEEAIQVMRLLWSGGRGLRFDGTHYRLEGAQGGPVPAHPIGMWLGALGPRMLTLTGRVADGVIHSLSYIPPERLDELHGRIDEAAVEAGRSPSDVRRVYNVMGLIQPARGDQPLVGPPSQWVEELTRYALEHGQDTFVVWPLDDHLAQIERFAAEVVPAVREAVARARAATG